ncbi:MAG: Fic family protein [Archangium sp.]
MEALLQFIENQPLGVTRAEIEMAVGGNLAGQRLVRALRSLEAEGLIRFEGNTRARRYFRVGGSRSESASAVPLSPEARDVLEQVRRPLHTRAPASYQRDFLDAYVPGKTFYLPAATRERLAVIGRTGDASAPAGTYARHVLERFLLDLSWGSSALEGNTYSLLDTEKLFARGQEAAGKSHVETQMLLNHKSSIEFLVAEPAALALDERTVKSLHALLTENLLGNALDEGRLRSTPVQIGQSTYLPSANPGLIDEAFRQVLAIARRIDDAFECAFFLLVQLPYLQPFIDGNKRTARLAANIPFVVRNLVPLTFVDVPRELFTAAQLAVYELNRLEPLRDLFVWAYERSTLRLGQVRSALGEPDAFRLKHRETLRRVVRTLVQERVPPEKRRAFIERFADQHLPLEDRARFLATAEREVEALSDATFARYGLRPSEFAAWRELTAGSSSAT